MSECDLYVNISVLLVTVVYVYVCMLMWLSCVSKCSYVCVICVCVSV